MQALPMNSNTEIDAVRLALAKSSFWNIGYFAAGFIFWIWVLVTGVCFPIEEAKIYWLVGTFFIFPMAVSFSRIMGADPFSKGNILGELVGYTHLSVISLTFPVVILFMVYYPEAMIFFMAIAYCLDFYVMTWAFGSPLFGIHAAVRVIVVSIIWFAVPDLREIAIPVVVALAYLVTIALIPFLRNKWIKRHTENK